MPGAASSTSAVRLRIRLVALAIIGLLFFGVASLPALAESSGSRSPDLLSSLGGVTSGFTPLTGVLGGAKEHCIYPADSLKTLDYYESLTGQTYNCVLLYNDAKPEWSDWVTPWFAHPPSSDSAFIAWKKAQAGRRLILSQPMVPDDAPSNWRGLGAEGAYNGYATQLAKNLVAEGLGNSIIRLGWEANGPFNIENELGSDSSQWHDWAVYWGNIVRAMKAVPGADFIFDWTINQYYQPIPLTDWYPGNDVVDIIGIDAYDSGATSTPSASAGRYAALSTEPDGLDAVAAFAQQHGKPISIPEWGLVEPGSGEGAGDDPSYIAGLANFIQDHDVAYDSYFVSGPGENLLYLPQAPKSLQAYRQDFHFLSLPGLLGTLANR